MNVARDSDLLAIMAVDAVRQTLYDSNDFLRFMRDYSGIAMQAKEVQIVRKGARVPVKVNDEFGAGTVKRTKAAIAKFTLDKFETEPEAVTQEEVDKLVFDKKSEQLDNHTLSIQDRFANAVLHQMIESQTVVVNGTAVTETLPADHIIFTTGDLVGGHRLIRIEDLLTFRKGVRNAKLPLKGWKMLADVELENQIMNLPGVLKALDFGGTAVLPEGILARILGIDFVEGRSYVPHYTTDDPPAVIPLTYDVAEEDPNAFIVNIPDPATARRSILLWHPDYVAKAIGLIEVFFRDKDPIYKADIFDMQAYAGFVRMLNQAVFVITEGVD